MHPQAPMYLGAWGRGEFGKYKKHSWRRPFNINFYYEKLTYNEALLHHCAKLIVDKNRIQYITKVKIETRFHNRKHVYNFIWLIFIEKEFFKSEYYLLNLIFSFIMLIWISLIEYTFIAPLASPPPLPTNWDPLIVNSPT